jgi:hypothetical protein
MYPVTSAPHDCCGYRGVFPWQGKGEGMRRLRCTICAHQERARAELLLAKGDGYTEVAKRLGLSVDALERHWKRHTSEEYREALAPGGRALAARDALTAQVAEEASSELDNLKASRAAAWQGVVKELIAGNTTKLAMILAQHTKICISIARINGELRLSPLISSTTINNTMTAVFESPKFQKFERALLVLANKHPQLQPELLELIKVLDDEEEPAPQRPALEHESQRLEGALNGL